MRLAPATERNLISSWPSLPYKGLNYYGPEDIPIFAGREQDTELCARLVTSASTSILIVHGSTGCGKSSFLRAGLIPFLEHRERGYSFVRTDSGEVQSYFVRSTDDPLSRLAETIFGLALQEPIIRDKPTGSSILDLSQCVTSEASNLEEFIHVVTSSPSQLVESLSCIARKLPETLVLVIDQMEEMLTLRPGIEGEDSRSKFIDFLEQFMERNVDIKIILAIRTEFFGRLIDELRQSINDTTRISDYLLRDLSEEQLIRAIVRPTLDQSVGNYGNPRQHYRFKFAPSVPQAIAEDLRAAVPAGGVLPVMQIVCGRLYKLVQVNQGNEIAEITHENYDDLGGVEGQIEGHLNETLSKLCELESLSTAEKIRESKKWRKVLLTLAKSQVDGTVTTEVKTADELRGEVEKMGCQIPAREAFDLLSREEHRVLRPVTVYNPSLRAEIPCFALGHDAIGLVLKNWTVSGDRATRLVDSLRSTSKVFSAALLFMTLVGDILYALSSIIFAFGFEWAAFIGLNISALIYIASFYIVSVTIQPRSIVPFLRGAAILYRYIGLKSVDEKLSDLAEEAIAATKAESRTREFPGGKPNKRKVKRKPGIRPRRPRV
jgi:hypothetical protein